MSRAQELLQAVESRSRPVVKELYKKYSNAAELIDAATEAGVSVSDASDLQAVLDAAKTVNVSPKAK